MKKFFLYNSLFALLTTVIFALFINQGFFVGLIMRQDIIYFVIVIPVYSAFGVFGFFYQILSVDRKQGIKQNWWKVVSALNSVLIMMILVFSHWINLTAGSGLIIVLIALPWAINLMVGTMTWLNKKQA